MRTIGSMGTVRSKIVCVSTLDAAGDGGVGWRMANSPSVWEVWGLVERPLRVPPCGVGWLGTHPSARSSRLHLYLAPNFRQTVINCKNISQNKWNGISRNTKVLLKHFYWPSPLLYNDRPPSSLLKFDVIYSTFNVLRVYMITFPYCSHLFKWRFTLVEGILCPIEHSVMRPSWRGPGDPWRSGRHNGTRRIRIGPRAIIA